MDSFMRYTIVVVLASFAVPAFAQDMPLHEILVPGESWKEDRDAGIPKSAGGYLINRSDELMYRDKKIEIPFTPTIASVWHNGSTLVVAEKGAKQLWAFRIEADGSLSGGERYMTLRTRTKTSDPAVTVMCTDSSNRLYVAASEGIHVYDPTGRLCGVFEAPKKGRVLAMTFIRNGSELLVVIEGSTYVRKMMAKEPAK
jgi:hypothetical protein